MLVHNLSMDVLNFPRFCMFSTQIVVAKQDALKVTLTKVSINDEHPENSQLVHVINTPEAASYFFPAISLLS